MSTKTTEQKREEAMAAFEAYYQTNAMKASHTDGRRKWMRNYDATHNRPAKYLTSDLKQYKKDPHEWDFLGVDAGEGKMAPRQGPKSAIVRLANKPNRQLIIEAMSYHDLQKMIKDNKEVIEQRYGKTVKLNVKHKILANVLFDFVHKLNPNLEKQFQDQAAALEVKAVLLREKLKKSQETQQLFDKQKKSKMKELADAQKIIVKQKKDWGKQLSQISREQEKLLAI